MPQAGGGRALELASIVGKSADLSEAFPSM
jgi:hypothetical protein